MRLLRLMAGAAEGGAETFFMRLAVALQSSKIDQHLVIRPEPERETSYATQALAWQPLSSAANSTLPLAAFSNAKSDCFSRMLF